MNQPPLRNFRSNVTSRHGENGIIAEIFKRIGAQNKWCVEFGASNGTKDSNVWTLIHGHGWSGVLIEADRTAFEKLTEAYKATPQAICLNVFISFKGENKLDSIFARTPLPKDFDLVSIDIDGNDYHVWESLVEYRPRVIVVEFNPTIPNDIVFVQPRDMAVQQGSSLLALLQLGKEKGYELVEVVNTNAFFVDAALVPALGLSDTSVTDLHPETDCYTRVFQLFDGTLVLDGYKELMWHRLPITHEAIQILPTGKRVYPAGISASSPVRSLKYWVRKSPFYPALTRLKKWITRS